MNATNTSSPHNATISPTSFLHPATPANTSIPKQTSIPVHLANHTRRAGPPQNIHLGPALHPTNETLNRIHSVLVSNSPEADILFMLLEIILPILGVIAFLTLMLLIMRHITNRLYPNPKDSSDAPAIELSSMRNSATSDRTLVNPRKLSMTRGPKVGRFPDSKYGGVFAWRLAMERPKQVPQNTGPRVGEAFPRLNVEGVEGGQAPRRASSSTYSRSMDGVTLYPGRSWGSR